jgi:hypothetical protein
VLLIKVAPECGIVGDQWIFLTKSSDSPILKILRGEKRNKPKPSGSDRVFPESVLMPGCRCSSGIVENKAQFQSCKSRRIRLAFDRNQNSLRRSFPARTDEKKSKLERIMNIA